MKKWIWAVVALAIVIYFMLIRSRSFFAISISGSTLLYLKIAAVICIFIIFLVGFLIFRKCRK